MIRPNFLIIGAPKCGTSSLFNWLVAHPDIVGTQVKEPFFLVDRDHPHLGQINIHNDGVEGYAALFPQDAEAATIRMEATTHYLYQDTARHAVQSWPDAKVAVVMRDPAERVYSSFSYTKHNLARLDAELTFSDYVDLIQSGQSVSPKWCAHAGSAYVLDRDLSYSRYVEHLSKWLDALGPDRVMPILFEDLRADPGGCVSRVLSWLELPPMAVAAQDLAARNTTQAHRSQRLHGLARKLNAAVRLPPRLKAALRWGYAKAQGGARVERSAADQTSIAALRQHYAADTARLADLTGLDLSMWQPGAGPSEALEAAQP